MGLFSRKKKTKSDYLFTDEPQTACLTCKHILDEEADVLFVSHDNDDGGWQFLCDENHEESDARVVGLGDLISLHKELNFLHEMPLGIYAERRDSSSEWVFYNEDINLDGIPGKNITLETLEEMFTNMEKETNWDIKSDCVWGYFFTYSSPDRLEEAAQVLSEKGYKVVDIYMSDKDDADEVDQFWLHIEKVETHSPQSLDKRNDEFYIFANEFGLDSYDGMDVGPVEE